MNRKGLRRDVAGLAASLVLATGCRDAALASAEERAPSPAETVMLPAPRTTGAVALETAIHRRRSQRTFGPGSLTTEELAQLAWAAQGITDEAQGLRAAPSAGALYPLELYVVDAQGIWRYEPPRNALQRVATGDHRSGLARAALGQPQVGAAAADLVITGVVARTRAKYGDRAERYVHVEVGHAAQNVLLEATALGLAAVPVGAFDDDAVRAVLGIGASETPMYVVCVGRPPR